MPSGQKQQSMEKIVSPRWSLGGSVRKLSSLSLSVEVASLCKTQAGFVTGPKSSSSNDVGPQAVSSVAEGSVGRLSTLCRKP